MKKEEGWLMYTEINKFKNMGLNKSQIARRLLISRPTLNKYLNMSPEEFESYVCEVRERRKKADSFKEDIVCWLKEFPEISASQMFDWLEEKFQVLPFKEGTLRRYIRTLRQEYNIPKTATPRQYSAVDEIPMGKQIQVDFGTIKVPDANGKYIRLYVMCFILSHSRYKYCEWLDRPFTTDDTIRIHENAFEYYGGIAEEIVYDQDHLFLVSENYGDLIYTKAFSKYIKKRKYKVYMCRKADPESKGRIEKVVDYVKSNYAKHRTFYNIDKWNEGCLDWLERRGNGKMHGTTRKIPAEVFIEERKYLKPVLDKIKHNYPVLSVTYQVRKDNTVPIKGNRYSVPRGTYKGPHTYVKVNYTDDNELVIIELDTDKVLGRFRIPVDKGNLLKNNDHKREKGGKIIDIINKTATKFSNPDTAKNFMELIRKEKPRYIRDQIMLIQKAIEETSLSSIDKALEFCLKNKLYRATDFQDAVSHYQKENLIQINNSCEKKICLKEEDVEKIKISPKIRDMSEYISALGGYNNANDN
ncbi:UNVERIFIED_CONTAM: transposase [Acetivibrio alkalicellulosi]